MIDDYKYMYLYTPYIYMGVYIKDCIDIWDFSLVGVGWVLESWLQVEMP
jgi:hypothetical protein